MESAAQRLEGLKAEFAEFTDSFDRYSYLVELAGLLPLYPDERRNEAHLVKGCQSHVWLSAYERDGLFGDSDTLILKGLLLLLQDLFCGLPLRQASDLNLDLLSDLGLNESFPDQRQKGIGYIFQRLRGEAERLASCERVS